MKTRTLIILTILLILVGVAWYHTLTEFTPTAESILSEQSSMQSQLTTMQSELTEISEAAESWPGVTETEPLSATVTAETTKTTAVRMTSIGKFTVYAYCRGPNGLLTATGTTCGEGQTVAADFGVLAPGTLIYIEGVGERIVEDCGVSGRTLDLFIADEDECWQWGKQQREVWVIEE